MGSPHCAKLFNPMENTIHAERGRGREGEERGGRKGERGREGEGGREREGEERGGRKGERGGRVVSC